MIRYCVNGTGNQVAESLLCLIQLFNKSLYRYLQIFKVVFSKLLCNNSICATCNTRLLGCTRVNGNILYLHVEAANCSCNDLVLFEENTF